MYNVATLLQQRTGFYTLHILPTSTLVHARNSSNIGEFAVLFIYIVVIVLRDVLNCHYVKDCVCLLDRCDGLLLAHTSHDARPIFMLVHDNDGVIISKLSAKLRWKLRQHL